MFRLFSRNATCLVYQGVVGIAARPFHSSGIPRVVGRANHYGVLGVPSSATAAEIKGAFYRQSMQWHPDRNSGSEEAHHKFLKISEAYSVLGTEAKRLAYDRTMRIRTNHHHSGAGPHRYHNTAFSSSGEYQTARPNSYRRPESSYYKGRVRGRSNFEEWERMHYHDLQARAQRIHRDVKDSSGDKAKFTNSQIAVVQFWELVLVFSGVFGVAWLAEQALLRKSPQKE